MQILGVDIGGSGMKAAVVDVEKGEMVDERVRIETPRPARPEPMAEVVARLVAETGWQGPVGCGFPGVVRGGVVRTAANLSKRWVDDAVEERFSEATSLPVRVVNDADAAGLAEMRFGAGRGRSGKVLLLTLGTGIGSALFLDGELVPNTELGHLEIDGKVAESMASSRAREEEGLGWDAWAVRLDRYLAAVQLLTWPDLVILGGGVSKKHEKFLPRLETPLEIVPAALRNGAGIVGAALAALPGTD